METFNENSRELDKLLLMCRVDPNVYIEFIAGYRQGDIHKNFQKRMSILKSTYDEYPRGHGKTDQCIYRDSWDIGNNPNILIKVVKANQTEAVEHVEAVKTIIESPKFALVFPEIRSDSRNWGKESFRVQRTLMSKDPTIKAAGVFGTPGGRADVMRFDDICTLKNSVQSAVTRDEIKRQVLETWLPMLKPGGRVHRICTPWHVNDVSADWRRDPTISVCRKPCRGVVASPWTEYWTPELLEERRAQMGEIAYARAYLLQPVTGEELVFRPEDMLDATIHGNAFPIEGEVICAIDMAFTSAQQISRTKKANPDYSVATVARITKDGHVYPLALFRARCTFPTFSRTLKQLIETYKVTKVLSENVAAMIGLNQQLAQDMPADIITSPRTVDKHTRAIEVQPHVENFRLHFPLDDDGDIDGEFNVAYDEMVDFPFGNHDDIVDTLIDLLNYAGDNISRRGGNFPRTQAYPTGTVGQMLDIVAKAREDKAGISSHREFNTNMNEYFDGMTNYD